MTPFTLFCIVCDATRGLKMPKVEQLEMARRVFEWVLDEIVESSKMKSSSGIAANTP